MGYPDSGRMRAGYGAGSVHNLKREAVEARSGVDVREEGHWLSAQSNEPKPTGNC
jgi:hypothetical protein